MGFDYFRKIEAGIKNLLGRKFFSFAKADFKSHDLIFDFLKTYRDPENYLIFLLKKILNSADSQKEIYSNTVAMFADKIIGFDSRIFFPDYYYWGSSVVVHPRFRKLGLAGRLIGIGEKNISILGIKINKIRTAVVFENIPIFSKLGFDVLGRWYILSLKLGEKNTGLKLYQVRKAVDSDLEHLGQFLSESDYFVASAQMFAEDLIWYPLNRAWIGGLIKDGRVLLNGKEGKICGAAIINYKSLINPFCDGDISIMEVGYFDGDWAPILDFIQKNYHPDFLRIYSKDGIPLKYLPPAIKNAYSAKFNDLFGGLNRLDFSGGKLFFTSITLMQKLIKN